MNEVADKGTPAEIRFQTEGLKFMWKPSGMRGQTIPSELVKNGRRLGFLAGTPSRGDQIPRAGRARIEFAVLGRDESPCRREQSFGKPGEERKAGQRRE